MRNKLYPCVDDFDKYYAELKREKYDCGDPDFVGGKPNYDAFHKWSPEEVLCWLNID